MSKIVTISRFVQYFSLTALLVFSPLARGAAQHWAFCVSLWLAAVSMGFMLIGRMYRGESPLPRSGLDLPILGLVFLSLISIFTTADRDATFWALLRFGLYLSAYYLALEACSSRKATIWLAGCVTGMGLILVIIGLVKYLHGPIPDFWVYAVRDEYSFLTSTFANHNHLAGYLEMALLLGAGLAVCGAASGRIAWGTLLTITAAGLVLSRSRGAWMATAIAAICFVLVVLAKRRAGLFKPAAATAILTVVLALLFLWPRSGLAPDRPFDSGQTSFLSRVMVWKSSVKLVAERPLTGTGLGTFPWVFPKVRQTGLTNRYYHAHNDYLQLVIELGLPVLLPLGAGLYLLFRQALRTYFNSEERLAEGVALGAMGGLTAMLAHSFFDFNIQITSNGLVFSLLAGLAMGADRLPGETAPAKAEANNHESVGGSGRTPLGQVNGTLPS